MDFDTTYLDLSLEGVGFYDCYNTIGEFNKSLLQFKFPYAVS